MEGSLTFPVVFGAAEPEILPDAVEAFAASLEVAVAEDFERAVLVVLFAGWEIGGVDDDDDDAVRVSSAEVPVTDGSVVISQLCSP